MRRLKLAAAGLAALMTTGLMSGGRAEAMPAAGLAAPAATEQVRLVCRPVWNGYRWVQSCYRTGPAYYYGGPAFYGPRPYYGYRPYWRRRFY